MLSFRLPTLYRETDGLGNGSNARRSPFMRRAAVVFIACAIIAAPPLAHAYIGPGAGFALVSSFLTFIIAFFAAFFAVLTFPIRVFFRWTKRRKIRGKSQIEKVIILGLDGLDPEICERLMTAGELPNFSRMMEEGSFRRLATSTPAMSPVAWSTFSTGADASRHGIFDFLGRDPRSYLPILSSSRVTAGTKFLKIGPFRLPLQKGSVKMLRKSKTFWKVLSEYGIFSAVLRVPITFPPEKIHGVMLSGMCVPDLRGTMGSFTYFTKEGVDEATGGMIIPLRENGGTLEAMLPGPASPTSGETLALPLSIRAVPEKDGAEITVGKDTLFLKEKEYSPWTRLAFKAAPGMTLHGIARFYLTELNGNVGLYVSPIHIDPERPAMPISSPPFYSIYLAKKNGLFGTLGLAEDTWAVNERILDEEAFLKQAYMFHHERETMFLESLKKLKHGLSVCVFDLSDRLQHMFFRYLDEDHAANRDKDVIRHREALYDMYRAMDRLVAKTLHYVDEKTAFFIISDHGFKSFRKGVDLNGWLEQNGYLALKEGGSRDTEYLQDVDWSKTRAYAVGLGGIFINKKGRERHGIVTASEFGPLKKEIISKLAALTDKSGTNVVNRTFDVETDFTGPYRTEGPDLLVGFREGYRVSWECAKGKVTERIIEDNEKSWSGDHCMDPDTVPGVFFSNMKPNTDAPRLMDIGPTVLDLFGIEPPRYMTGKSLAAGRKKK